MPEFNDDDFAADEVDDVDVNNILAWYYSGLDLLEAETPSDIVGFLRAAYPGYIAEHQLHEAARLVRESTGQYEYDDSEEENGSPLPERHQSLEEVRFLLPRVFDVLSRLERALPEQSGHNAPPEEGAVFPYTRADLENVRRLASTFQGDQLNRSSEQEQLLADRAERVIKLGDRLRGFGTKKFDKFSDEFVGTLGKESAAWSVRAVAFIYCSDILTKFARAVAGLLGG